jgi:flagellar basal body rod protein FlgG
VLNGMSAAASGLLAAEAEVSVAEANLSNNTTLGYKMQSVPLQPFDVQLLDAFGPQGGQALGSAVAAGVVPGTSVLDLAEGPLQATGDPLDVAVLGPGFFAVQAGAGVAYTRDGAFHVDASGTLVDAAGERVLSTLGAPITGLDGAARILSDGTVVDRGRVVARLALYDLPATVQEQGGRFLSATRTVDTTSVLDPGALELSNTNDTEVLVGAVAAAQAYQAAASAFQAEDTTLSAAVTQVGAVG